MKKYTVFALLTYALILGACDPGVEAPTGGEETNEVVIESESSSEESSETSESSEEEASSESTESESSEESTSSSESSNDDETTADLNEDANLENMEDISQIPHNFYLRDAINDMIASTDGFNISVSEVSFIQKGDDIMYNVIGWNGEHHFDYQLDAETGQDSMEKIENVQPLDQIDWEDVVVPENAVVTASEETDSEPVQWHLHLSEEEGFPVYDIQFRNGDVVTVQAVDGEVI